MKINITKPLFVCFLLIVTANLSSQSIIINEFMSSNDGFLADKDGEYSDWIKLYNNENQAVNLQGFGLSDDADNLNKWIFPNVSIPAKGFLLIFASGKNIIIQEVDYPIFTNTDVNKRIILRNAGQDFLHTHFRDVFLQSLLEPLGMELQGFQPAVLFINGEYWGIHNLRGKYDEFYFINSLGIEEDNLNILGVCGSQDYGSNADYQELIDYIYNNDLSETIHYEYVKNQVDIENYIHYQIAEIFYANFDWPCNNHKIWKTNDADSKWRYLIYDVDISFNINRHTHQDSLGMQHATALYERWNLCECSNILFIKLLENESFKNLFINTFEEHLNTIFHPETVLNKLKDLKKIYVTEMEEHINRWNYPSSLSTWYEEIQKLEEFAIHRPCLIKEDLMNFFDLETVDYQCVDEKDFQKKYELSVYPNPSQGNITIQNTIPDDCLIGNVTIFNTNGQTVFYQKDIILKDDETIDLNISNLSNGVYFISYQNVDFIVTEKLVLIR